MNEQWQSRITIEPGKRSGQPCIRNMRITVQDVLADFPELTDEDLRACLAFAADRERRLRSRTFAADPAQAMLVLP